MTVLHTSGLSQKIFTFSFSAQLKYGDKTLESSIEFEFQMQKILHSFHIPVHSS